MLTSKTSKNAPPFLVVANDPYGSDVSTNPFAVSVVPAENPLAILPLAVSTPSISKYVGQLASSWKITPTSLTVNLRKGIRWQDGQPVTATDVADSALLNGLDGNAMWEAIDGITTPNDDTVVFHLRSNISSYIAESNILTMAPLPMQQYGQFVPPNIEKDLVAYNSLLQTNPTAATSSSYEKVISSAFTKLVHYKPSKVIGDGPFKLEAITSSEVKYVRWPASPFAKNIRVPTIIWQESSTSTNAGELFSKEADYSWTGFGGSIIKRALHTPGLHLYYLPSFGQDGFYFNDKRYPTNLLPVRQAIAYVINRKRLTLLETGGVSFKHVTQHPDLIDHQIVSQYLTKAQLDSLNTYSYNPTKATKLLQSVGFKKKGQWWYLPDGKQFTLSITGPAGWTGPGTAPIVAADMLTKFGIKATGSDIEQPGYWTYQQQGSYLMDWGWGAGSVDPLLGLSGVLGPNENFPTLGNYKGDPGIGFGPTMNVPGLGNVDVSTTIEHQAETVSPGPEMKKLTQDWAQLVNKELPVIAYNTRGSPLYWSDIQYKDWPPKSSPLWAITAINVGGQGIMLMMEHGYIRPRS